MINLSVTQIEDRAKYLMKLLVLELDEDNLKQVWYDYWICLAAFTETCRLLSDTTKSGRLFFPQFALAFYLCRLELMRRKLPLTLSKPTTHEVLRVVDTISSGVPDNQSQPLPLSSASISDSSIGSSLTPWEGTRCNLSSKRCNLNYDCFLIIRSRITLFYFRFRH